MNWKGCGRKWPWPTGGISPAFLKGTEKNHEEICHDSRCPGLDSNLLLSECKSKSITAWAIVRPRCGYHRTPSVSSPTEPQQHTRCSVYATDCQIAESWSTSSRGKRFISCSNHRDRFWIHPGIFFFGVGGWSVKLTTRIYLVSNFEMSVAVPPLPACLHGVL